jgi:hypothetical protein
MDGRHGIGQGTRRYPQGALRVKAISASGMAALLRVVLVQTAAAQPDSRPHVDQEQVWR